MAPLPVPSLLGPIPTGFDDWFARAAAREKSARFQSIKEAADSLRALCGRTSGRPSAVSYPNANVRGDTALSSGVTVPEFSAQPAKSVAVAGLQTTSVPSSRSIPGLPAPGRSRAKLLVLAVSVFVIGGLYVGWRWMSQGETTVASSAPPVVSAAAAAGAQSTASSASVTPEPAPVIVEKADAGLSADNSAEHAVVTPQPVRITAPRAAPTKSDKAITRAEPAVPETAKEPPPLATATPPISAPKKRNENAAGI